ncbi:MAG: hypothetical protein P9X24_00875 [Candidatus Hatepunaea meridiana]|nr:hypothetical protein [Candidatus Hatepunaea meridiana]
MDTDYLTTMAYNCLRYANDASDILKSELGAACSDYKTEDEYLDGILKDIKEIEMYPEEYLDWWNLLEQMDVKMFVKKIRIMREHIEKTITTPRDERGKPEW